MADIAFGSVEKIVKIALKIKEAVETVKQNEEECHDIHRCVNRVCALLKRLDETTETMRDEVMRDALEDLTESLERALRLVTECQRKHKFRRFLGAGDMAKELDNVQNDIMRKLQLGTFATNVQSTVMLTNIQSTGAPQEHKPPPRPEVSVNGFTMFSSSELKHATNDFSDENIIARGQAAIIWKGALYGGQVVAIKKFSDMFLNENQDNLYDQINIFIELKHQNVARPLGYSHEIIMVLFNLDGKYKGAEQRQFCFVEEYMPGGSMADAIKKGMDWPCRFKMIQGIAHGLHYLHEHHVVHLDLKPANILLDSNNNAMIGEFGTARKLDHGDEVTCDIDYLVGTPGFMAPEFLSKGILSTKCDVYAFGATLLWTISTMCRSSHRGIGDSIEWAWEARDDLRMEFFNASLRGWSQLMQIKRCMEIGLLCIDFDKICRPTMAEVLNMLNGYQELPAPKRPYGYSST